MTNKPAFEPLLLLPNPRSSVDSYPYYPSVVLMDCVIAGPASVKLFCSSISCLSKIGKDLYLEHDVASGVVLRALNDAKSAYCSMKFAPSFFERCSTPTTTTSAAASSNGGTASRRRRHAPASPSPSLTQSSNGVSVRMAMRAMLPVVKPRRDVVQLRITSVAEDDDGESSSSSPLRLAFEFLVVRRTPDGAGMAAAAAGGHRHRGRGTYHYDSHNTNGHSAAASADDTLIRIVHCIPASDADAVSAVLDTSLVPSELACHPRTLLRLLEPLSRFKNVTEVALVIQKNSNVLTAQSFHHTDRYRVVPVPKQAQQQQTSAAPAAAAAPAPMLQWVQRERDASRVVKTEASMSVEELERFAFQDDRQRPDEDEEVDDEDLRRDVPDHVNDGVVLVFPVKEARAFLQFGAAFASSTQSSSASVVAGTTSLDSAVVQFHWGGKPVVMELASSRADDDGGDGPGYSPHGREDPSSHRHRDFFASHAASALSSSSFAARLVLASLDHKLLADASGDGNDNDNDNENSMTTSNR
jgi:Rad9